MNGGEQTALKISDFLTQTQLRGSEIYTRVYRPWGFRHNLSASVNSRLGTAAGVGLCNGKKEFTERDRLVMNLIRPHFDQAHRNAKLATSRLAAAVKPRAAYGLTPRESEIAHWIAASKSNPEIALLLRCAARTIEKHMEKILDKLGVENRVAAAVVIARAGDPRLG